MKPEFTFLVGTSATGKTTAMNAVTELDDKIIKVPMSARTERAKINNPSWKSLMENGHLANLQQDFIFKGFCATILETAFKAVAPGADLSKSYMFERSPMCVAGYSHAFGLSELSIKQLDLISKFLFPMLTNTLGIQITVIHTIVDDSLPYAWEEARPPEIIRDSCGNFLYFALDHVKANLDDETNSNVNFYNYTRGSSLMERYRVNTKDK